MGSLVKRGSKGFTLVELMVVVAILAVLMTIVFPAVTGTKSASTEGQVQSDAQSVSKGVDNFQNKGIKPAFPEQPLGTSTSYYLPSGTKIFKKGNATGTADITVGTTTGSTVGANALGVMTPFVGSDVPAYKELKWNATTNVWQPSTGSVNATYFVPDYIGKTPASVTLQNDEGVGSAATGYDTTKLAEFLWLLKVNNPGSADESRTVEVFRLASAASSVPTYAQVY